MIVVRLQFDDAADADDGEHEDNFEIMKIFLIRVIVIMPMDN